jgi:uncharacterized protein (TIGR01319 family)
MQLALLVDFGSTYTKLAAMDLDGEKLVGWAQAGSTVDTDMTLAYREALSEIKAQLGSKDVDFDYRLCCSSAAGGLRIICSGLVPSLTSKAAMFAGCSAGGKVIGCYSYELSDDEKAQVEELRPDIVMLVGGTDGGDKKTIINNAKLLATTRLECPFIMAGNKSAAAEVRTILRAGGKDVIVTDNVLPELHRLNIPPVQESIEKAFMGQIINGKGLEKAKSLINPRVIPTPLAVFNAAQLLARGTEQEEGLGELVVIDVGGSTTDVDSMSEGKSAEANVIEHGIPEPFAKRTVEGDLGLRSSASIVAGFIDREKMEEISSRAGSDIPDIADIREMADFVATNTDHVPQTKSEVLINEVLAFACVDLAMTRHSGKMELIYSPAGEKFLLKSGKDLRGITKVIGTGGVFAHEYNHGFILQGVKAAGTQPLPPLKPEAPEFFVDKGYILYAMGLLGEVLPDKALRILKKSLHKV